MSETIDAGGGMLVEIGDSVPRPRSEYDRRFAELAAAQRSGKITAAEFRRKLAEYERTIRTC